MKKALCQIKETENGLVITWGSGKSPYYIIPVTSCDMIDDFKALVMKHDLEYRVIGYRPDEEKARKVIEKLEVYKAPKASR
jgi:hypothetical protein